MLPAALARAAPAHPGKRIALYLQDEARFGQTTGRSCGRWWLRGQRPTGPVDQRNTFAYVFAAVKPITGRDFCLVLRAISIIAMSEFMRRFPATLPEDEHAVMVLNGAAQGDAGLIRLAWQGVFETAGSDTIARLSSASLYAGKTQNG